MEFLPPRLSMDSAEVSSKPPPSMQPDGFRVPFTPLKEWLFPLMGNRLQQFLFVGFRIPHRWISGIPFCGFGERRESWESIGGVRIFVYEDAFSERERLKKGAPGGGRSQARVSSEWVVRGGAERVSSARPEPPRATRRRA